MAGKSSSMPLTRNQLLILALIVVLVLFAFGYTGRLIANGEMQAQVQLWEEELRLEEERLEENLERLEYVQSDQYVIDRARVDLGWVFPGEVAVRMVDRPDPVIARTPPPPAEPVPVLQGWLERLIGR